MQGGADRGKLFQLPAPYTHPARIAIGKGGKKKGGEKDTAFYRGLLRYVTSVTIQAR